MLRLFVLVLIVSFAACGVPKETYDADMANLKSKHATALKAEQDKAQAAWKKQSGQLKGTAEQLASQKTRGDKLAAELATSKEELKKCTDGATSSKGKKRNKRRKKR